jgi:hypothetical protein
MIKKRKLSHKAGFFFKYELLFSVAYVDLPKSARDLLHCFLPELKYTRPKGRVSYYNNGDVSFTEIQFKEEFGYASNTYLSARNRLIRNGLIKQTYRGGCHRGDMAKYKILIAPDLNPREMRWLRYPKENWENDIPRSKTTIGINTRFKSKTTLKKSTLNSELHP